SSQPGFIMALEIKLSQKLSQSLLMTPQLQQAIKLLQLGRLEYKEAIEKELLENPVLEEIREDDSMDHQSASGSESPTLSNGDSSSDSEKPSETSQQNDDSPVDWEDYLANFSDSRDLGSQKGFLDNEDRPSLEATLTKSINLTEHIISQIRLSDLTELEKQIVFHVVGNLDKDGYLCVKDEEIAEACECDENDVGRMVEMVQSLDPPGVAARNLSECLLIQLDFLGLADTLSAKIVRSHLDKLERRKFDQIAKAEQVAIEKVYEAIVAIRNLEPRPGRQFADDTARYIVPDIYVYKDTGEWVISLNEDGLPKLRVSPYYLKLLQQSDTDNAPSRNYLTERLKAASWLIKSIHQRQQTIYKVTESIVKHQTDFLEFGIEFLKPMVLKDVADDIGMHESTVSRVTTNKYVHTPQGVFELKFFFSTGIKTSSGEVSSSSIKEKIRTIIADEAADDPVSDQQIVEMLGSDNIKIARRTVAKYRESLGILSSSKRKKFF
ncbi:MAG: RNA polymerase factor sigma-54, partial [Bdellovibrionales bacterium]|nr:RNA polymerase factor sigma-54 [Bdellovibrionales bacterium]